MSLCKNCISGVTHEGQTTGEIKKINGVDSYVAKPTTEYPKDKALLFLPDVFGIPLNNNKLLADDFAKVRARLHHEGREEGGGKRRWVRFCRRGCFVS